MLIRKAIGVTKTNERRIIQTPQDIYFERLLHYFPKLKIEEMSPKDVGVWAEKTLQIHSLRCKRCIEGERCYKSELLINITEVT